MGGYFHICPSVDLPGLSGHSAILWGQQDDAFGNFCSAIYLNSDSQMTLSGSPLICGGDITLDGNNISLSGNNTTLYSTCSSDLFTVNFYNPGDVGIGTTGPGNYPVLRLRYNDKVSCATELSTVEMALTGDLCVTGSVWSDSVVNVYGNQSICCNLSIVGIGSTGDPAEGCCAVFNLKSDCANSEIHLCTGSTNCFSKPSIEFRRSRDECYANDTLATTCSGDILGEINFKGVDCCHGYSQTDLYRHSLGVSIQAIQTDVPCYAINHVPAKLNINIPSVSSGQVVDSNFVFTSNNGQSIFTADTICANSLVAGNTLIPYDNVTCAPLLTSNLGCTNEVMVVSTNASNEKIVVSTPVIEVDTANHLVCLSKTNNDCTAPHICTIKARGSVGLGTTGIEAVKTCDDLFVVDVKGYDGSNYLNTGRIEFCVEPHALGTNPANVCEGALNTSLLFHTGCCTTPRERIKINPIGCVTFNNAYTFPLTSEDTDNNTFLAYNSSVSALEFCSFSNVDWTLYSSGITESVVNEITSTDSEYLSVFNNTIATLTAVELSTSIADSTFSYLSSLKNDILFKQSDNTVCFGSDADAFLRQGLQNYLGTMLDIGSYGNQCSIPELASFSSYSNFCFNVASTTFVVSGGDSCNLQVVLRPIGYYPLHRGFCYQCNGETNAAKLSADDNLYIPMPLLSSVDVDTTSLTSVSATLKYISNGGSWNACNQTFEIPISHIQNWKLKCQVGAGSSTDPEFDIGFDETVSFRAGDNICLEVDKTGTTTYVDISAVDLFDCWKIGIGGSSYNVLSGERVCFVEGDCMSISHTFTSANQNNGNVNTNTLTFEPSGLVPTSRCVTSSNTQGLSGGGDLTQDRVLGLTGQARCLHDLTLNNGSLIAKDSNGNYVSVLSSTFMDDTNTVYDPWILSASDSAGCFEVQSGCQVDFVGSEGIDVCRSNEQVFFSLSDNAKQLHDLTLGNNKVIVTDNSNNITQVNNCITVSLTGLSGDGDVTLGGTLNIGHANTSNQASIASSSCTYINSVTLDDYGHVTGLTTGTETGYCNGYGLSATGTEFGIDTDVLDALYLDNTNNYLSAATFNTTDGVLTLGRHNLTNVTVDLDGKYAEGHVETTVNSNSANWDTSYNDAITAIEVTGTTTKTITLTSRDGTTISNSFVDNNTVYDPWVLSASDTTGCFTVDSGCQVSLDSGSNICITRSNNVVTIHNSITNNNQLTNGCSYCTTDEFLTGGTFDGVSATFTSNCNDTFKVDLSGYDFTCSSNIPPLLNATSSTVVSELNAVKYLSVCNGLVSGFGTYDLDDYFSRKTDVATATATEVTVTLTGLSGVSSFALGDTFNIGHANTSNQADIECSARTYIDSVTLDDYGHVTALTTGTETVTDTTYSTGYGLSATGTEFGIDTDVLDALYLDNTNNFLTGGTFDGVSATFTKNDNTTFKVDLSGYDYSKLSNKPTLSTGTVQGSGTVGTIPIWKTNTTTLGDSLISENGADQYCFSKEVNSDLIFTIRNTCDTGTGTLQFCNDDNSCCGYIRKFGTSNGNTDCNNILKVYNDGGIRIFENTDSGIMLHGSQVGIGNTTGDIPLANGYDLTILGHTSASGNIVTQSHVCGAQVYDNGNRVCTSAVQLDELSVGANATASGSGGLAYNNTSGVFTYTPPVIPTDTNNYLSAASFNTSNGVLTLGRHNLTNVAVDLDGKYAEGHVETTVNSNSANWNTAYGWGDHSTEGYCKTHTHSSFTCLDLTTSSTTSAMAIAYRDQFKKTYTTQVSWCHQACGVQHFNLIFPYNNSSQGYMYDFKLVTDRNSTYQNFGFIRDNSYIYIEGDGDFLHRQEGLLQAGGTYSNSITLSGNPTVIRSDSPSATTTGGTSPYDYFIVRYPILFPNNNSGTAQVFVHVDVYSQNDGATVAFLKT